MTLVAISLPRPEAAEAITRCWDAGDAVLVLDPAFPRETLERLLERLSPEAIEDGHGRERVAGDPIRPGAAAVVVTSGTTGPAKGAELTVAGLEAIGAAFGKVLGVDTDDRALVCLPLHHVAGLAVLARARVNGTPVTVHPGFDLDAVAAAPEAEGATLVSLVPTMLHRLLEADAPLHAYRRIIVGGAPMSPELRERAEAAGAPVVDAYGLSETWGGFVIDGQPIPGADVTRSDEHEILVRGPMVMRGYRYGPRVSTEGFTADGWFKTGDIGEWTGDNRLRVVDRAGDIVISGGENVSPTEVEGVLARHKAIADVCVVGAPDPEWGERVIAFVVAVDAANPPTLGDVREFGHSWDLRPSEIPRQVVIVDEIPRTPGGKALRRELRSLL
jgi:o-succinylbenzoate---CoA ligase